MSDSLEQQQFVKWLRRPTLFIANAWYLLAAAGQYIVAFLLAFIASIAAFWGGGINESSLSYILSSVYEIGLLALPVVIYAARHDGVSQAMRLNPPRPASMLGAAAVAVIGVLAVNYLSIWWMLLIESLGGSLAAPGMSVPTGANELTGMILVAGVIPGVCEELFFRGGLMGAWERRGTKLALVITSTLFALLHGTVLGLPTQLIMGFVLGYILLLTDSLYVSMTYHTVHNSTALILAYIGQSMTGDAAAIDPYADMAGYIASTGGLGTLLLQTLVMTGAFVVALMLLTRSEKRRGGIIEKITRGDESKMTWQELLVLLAALMTVGMMYFSDILAICGII